MEQKKMHIIYSAEDIQQYLSGNLAPAEMHAMEKAALDDPFLAEAMEGFTGMQEENWNKQLLRLKQRFVNENRPKSKTEKHVTRMRPWRAAAAIVIICAGTGAIYMMSVRPLPEHETIASNNTRDSGSSTAMIHPATPANETNNQAAADNTVIASKKLAVPVKPPGPVTNTSKTRPPGESAKTNPLTDPTRNDKNEERIERKDITLADRPSTGGETYQLNKEKSKVMKEPAPAAARTSKTAQPQMQNFSSQVVDKNGSPLPFANITVPKENFGTYADANGNFRLLSSDSLLAVEIKSVGYITRTITLNTFNTQHKIVLAEDEQALKEKTLVTERAPGHRYDQSKKRRSIFEHDSPINAEPEDGWNNYDTYITNNLQVPDNVVQQHIHGDVIVSFDVLSDGAITNIRIDKSLCSDCDTAALRVIREGPRWKIKKGDKASGKLRLKF